jgi:hypothetical protein
MTITSPATSGTGGRPAISHQQAPRVIRWYEMTCWARGRMAGARAAVVGASAAQGVEASTRKNSAPVSLTGSNNTSGSVSGCGRPLQRSNGTRRCGRSSGRPVMVPAHREPHYRIGEGWCGHEDSNRPDGRLAARGGGAEAYERLSRIRFQPVGSEVTELAEIRRRSRSASPAERASWRDMPQRERCAAPSSASISTRTC